MSKYDERLSGMLDSMNPDNFDSPFESRTGRPVRLGMFLREILLTYGKFYISLVVGLWRMRARRAGGREPRDASIRTMIYGFYNKGFLQREPEIPDTPRVYYTMAEGRLWDPEWCGPGAAGKSLRNAVEIRRRKMEAASTPRVLREIEAVDAKRLELRRKWGETI